MAQKRPYRKKKEIDITKEVTELYKKNFECSDINLKKQFPLTENQTRFYHLSQHPQTNIVFVDGPAGSMKSYLAIYSALELLRGRHADQVIYIRSVVESSSKSMGFLPGEQESKFEPYCGPLKEKLNEILDAATITSLMTGKYIEAIPVNFVRGLTFHDSIVIIDESQNMTRGELTTILTRFGRNSKYFVCGDMKQCDIRDSGFESVFQAFDTDHSEKNHIHCVKFDTYDIARSPILKHITQVLRV